MMSMAKSARYEMYRLLRKVRDLEKSGPAYQNQRVKNLKQDIRKFQRDLRDVNKLVTPRGLPTCLKTTCKSTKQPSASVSLSTISIFIYDDKLKRLPRTPVPALLNWTDGRYRRPDQERPGPPVSQNEELAG